jgi:hypothetical protein
VERSPYEWLLGVFGLLSKDFFFFAKDRDFLLRRAESWRCRRVVDFVDDVEMVFLVAAEGGGVVPLFGGRTGGVAGVVVSIVGSGVDGLL